MADGKPVVRKGTTTMDKSTPGLAALAICESMLLSLADGKIINDREAGAILTDAEASHRNAALTSREPGKHHAAANLIKRIKQGKNSIRAF